MKLVKSAPQRFIALWTGIAILVVLFCYGVGHCQVKIDQSVRKRELVEEQKWNEKFKHLINQYQQMLQLRQEYCKAKGLVLTPEQSGNLVCGQVPPPQTPVPAPETKK